MIIASNKIPPIWTMLWLKKKFSNQNCESILIQILWGRRRVKRGMWNYIKPENNFAYQSNQAQVDMETQIEFSLMNFWRPCHRLPNPHLPPPPLFFFWSLLCAFLLSHSQTWKEREKYFFLLVNYIRTQWVLNPQSHFCHLNQSSMAEWTCFWLTASFFFWGGGGGRRIGRGGLSSNPSSQAPHKRCRNHRDIPQTLIDCHIFLKEAYSPSSCDKGK